MAQHRQSAGSPVAALLDRLHAARELIARAWLVRLLERSALDEVRHLPTDRIARELPGFVGRVVDAMRTREPERDPAADAELALRLLDLVGRPSGALGDAARDVASLQAAMFTALRREATDLDDETFAQVGERLASTLGGIQLAAVEDLVGARVRELERLANTDALTGLYNLRHLERQLDQMVAVHERYGHPFSLLMLDVDGLKQVNDAHGHAAGDRLLREVAGALRRTVRSVDTAVRLGGDEFCVLAVDQTASSAQVLARRVVAEVQRLDAPGGWRAAVSVGVVSCPEHGTDPARLLELADEAMYSAKAVTAGVVVAGERPPARAAPAVS